MADTFDEWVARLTANALAHDQEILAGIDKSMAPDLDPIGGAWGITGVGVICVGSHADMRRVAEKMYVDEALRNG